MLNTDQFSEMYRRQEQGGFTFNPRKDRFETAGYSVAVHPHAERTISMGETTVGDIKDYAAQHADILASPPEHIGGWRDQESGRDVFDLPKVYPPTGAGHTAARYQAVKHGQQALYSLHEGAEEANPFHPRGTQFPEFSRLAERSPSMAHTLKASPEIRAWVRGPVER